MTQIQNKKKVRQSLKVQIGNVAIGGNEPIIIQSMTNSDTANAKATAEQIIELYQAGSEIVRLTVNNAESAKALPKIKDILIQKNLPHIPLVGDFHYNGHQLLTDYPEAAMILDKYRINPGNVGFKDKRDKQFETMIEIAKKYQKPVRIGVNWGSLDQDLLAKLMDKNSKQKNPLTSNQILRKALILSALENAKKAEKIGLKSNQIVLSCKVSGVQDLISIYEELARKCNYPLHLGLTEAGIGSKGIVATSAALAVLLNKGIGDTIRASLTPKPDEPRSMEVRICQELLQTLGLRYFKPLVTSCPGCGRTSSKFFQQLADDIQEFIESEMPIWRARYPKSKEVSIAVMGCIVNGPGESKYATIGISLPGSGESPIAPVFVDGEKKYTLRGDNIVQEFKGIIENYIKENCG